MNATDSGTVTDSVTGRSVSAVKVAVSNAGRGRVETDVLGHFQIKNVKPGLVQLEFHAPSQTSLGEPIGTMQIMVVVGATTVADYQYEEAAFREPPCESITAEFHGRFSWGFEHCQFVPDGGMIQMSDGIGRRVESIWVYFTKPTERRPAWDVEYRVRWLATLTGPGSYGHMGLSDYYMLVHDTIEIEREETRHSDPDTPL